MLFWNVLVRINTNIDWDGLSQLRDIIVSLVERRDEIVASQNLDAAFCMPDGNWHSDSDNDYVVKYRALRDCPIQDVPNIVHKLSENYRGTSTEETYHDYTTSLLGFGFKPIGGLELLEIGAGYGVLASKLLQILGNDTKYIICDIPESLLFSGLYLALSGFLVLQVDCPPSIGHGITLIPNYWFNRLLEPMRKMDLVVNTLSMSEMSEHQVRVYASGISKLIGMDGLFFEHNFDNRHCNWGKSVGRGINCRHYISEYFGCHSKAGNASFWSIGLPRARRTAPHRAE